jgi:hypothetical protein
MNMALSAFDLQAAEYHRRAADCFEACARHHRLAAVGHDRDDLDAADHHAHEALQAFGDGTRYQERAVELDEQSLQAEGMPTIELERPLASVR